MIILNNCLTNKFIYMQFISIYNYMFYILRAKNIGKRINKEY